MTSILIGIIGFVVAAAIAAALFSLNRKPGGKCNDHSGGCGCGSSDAGSGGHSHSSGDSHAGDSGGGD